MLKKMSILHNGVEEQLTDKLLIEKWDDNYVWEYNKTEKPDYCLFNNCEKAIELLNKHIEANGRIILHTDVDMDGVGTTYIMLKFLKYMGVSCTPLIINKEKIHGIQAKQIDYINKAKAADLVIITDSSTNEVEAVKKFECDVLVIDHHDVVDKQGETFGHCNDNEHRFVIVNNTVENNDFEASKLLIEKHKSIDVEKIKQFDGDARMSCGLVVYELLRVYCVCFSDERVLENLKLYQWATITLFTDIVDTVTKRNQWYLDKTLLGNETEGTLNTVLNILDKYKSKIDKSFIQYKFAPLVNKTIRAGESTKALDIIINNINRLQELRKYEAIQKEAIERAVCIKTSGQLGIQTTSKIVFKGKTIMLDISNLDISKNYTGVIASRLSGDNGKSAAVYIKDNGVCQGSFRGKYKDIKYREIFEEYSSDIYAQGHNTSFGFKLTEEQLSELMQKIGDIEQTVDKRPYITMGNMTDSEMGVYHIKDISEFKQQGFLWKLAIGNSKVTSPDELLIRVKTADMALKRVGEKIFYYDVFGIECKAFSPIKGEYADVYLEYSGEISAYIRGIAV